jgi:hypothetical protein
MEYTPYDALCWAVKQMDIHTAQARQVVREATPKDRLQSLLKIQEILEELEKVSIQCAEVVEKYSPRNQIREPTEEEVQAAHEAEDMPSLGSPISLWEHCEQMGMNYDSDQSRGIN